MAKKAKTDSSSLKKNVKNKKKKKTVKPQKENSSKKDSVVKKQDKKNKDNKESTPKGMLMQIIGFGMMLIGFLLIVLPFAVNFFQKEKDNPYTQEVTFTEIDEKKDGEINDDAASTIRVNASTLSAEEKSTVNQTRMAEVGTWIATDYAEGDIGVGKYEVQRGDTLWEISEAVYGSGFEWHKILDRNSSEIGFLPNGSQALIIPGQVLMIAK